MTTEYHNFRYTTRKQQNRTLRTVAIKDAQLMVINVNIAWREAQQYTYKILIK